MSSRLETITKMFCCTALIVGLSGCASIGNLMNPYESTFSCQGSSDKGQCGSVQSAYAASLDGSVKAEPIVDKDKNKDKDKKDGEEVKTLSISDQYDLSYRTATLSKLNKLVEAPITPVVAPPTVMRVLMYSYSDDEDVLNMNRFSYIMLDKPRWVVGDGVEVSPR